LKDEDMDTSDDNDSPTMSVSTDIVRFIIDKAHEFQMLRDGSADDSVDGPNYVFTELHTTIDDLEPDQQVNVVGLMWLGRGDYSPEDWDKALADAGASWNERTAEYLIGTPLLADYLEEGLERLGFSAE